MRMSPKAKPPSHLRKWLAFTLTTLACDQASPRPDHIPLATITDSAGVVVIENSRPQWSTRRGWTVASEPEVTIGATGLEQQGTQESGVLFSVITHMQVLSSGRLAVADRHSATVSVFDTAGTFVHRFGGRGEGPGEFGAIWDLFACAADTVMVDFRSELSVFDGQGRFVGRAGIADGAAPLVVEAVYDDCGHFVAKQQSRSPPPGEEGLADDLMVRTDRWLSRHDTIGWEAGGEVYTATLDGGRNRIFYVPWTPVGTRPRVFGDDVVLGFGRWPEMRIYGSGGDLKRVLRWRAERVPVTAEDRQRYTDKRTAYIEMHGGALEALQGFPSLRDFPRIPSHKAVFDSYLVDELGNVWVRHYPPLSLGIEDRRPPVEDTTVSAEVWTVIGWDGLWLGPVELSEGFSLHQLARGRAYGVFSDENGVQTVHVYPIRRS